MTTSKGTIQGYNGLATVDKKHQVIVDAQTFGAGQEHHTLQPILETLKERYHRLNLNEDIFQAGAIITADTGFANEANIENRLYAQPRGDGSSKGKRQTGFLHCERVQAATELYRLDEAQGRQSKRKTDIQSSNVGGGTCVW